MANMTITGISESCGGFERLANATPAALQEMMQAYSDVALEKVKSHAASDLNGPYAQGIVESSAFVDGISVGGNGATAYINFKGVRKRKKSSTRHAEIAFLNEYGWGSKAGRQFIKNALDDAEDPAAEAAEQVLDNYLAQFGF